MDPLTTVRPVRRYQRLSTTILDDRTAMEAAFAVYPLTAGDLELSEGTFRIPPALWDIAGDLEWQDGPFPVKTLPEALAGALAECLESSYEPSRPPGVLVFANYLVREPLLPVRQSAIRGESLAHLVTPSELKPGMQIGAFVGAVVGGEGPFLLVSVPGGIIVGGAAWAVAAALGAGLHHLILSRFGVIESSRNDDPDDFEDDDDA